MGTKKPDVVVIVSDSLRQDHISFYAGKSSPAKTPHIDALLRDSVSFVNMYPQGLPTIPVRTEWVTGNGTLSGRSWQPLAPTDVTCAEILKGEGYITAFITDMYHYFKPGQNFHRGYLEWQWIRGQEYDSCATAPARTRRVDEYWKDSFPERWRALLDVVCRNLDACRRAADFPCAKTFERAADWVRRNASHASPLFLWVETFDPHEPWTPPEEFDVYGDPSYRGKDFILPPGGDASQHFSPEEMRRIRSLYAGEVSYVDAMVGELLRTLKDAGRYDDSVIFFLSDHGHPLADHGKFLKGPDRMYSELLKVPFGFKLPGQQCAGKTVDHLAQFPDFLPTLLDAAGLARDAHDMHGSSLIPLVRGEKENLREAVICGYHAGQDRCVRTREWSLILRPGDQPDELYNLADDPGEQYNVIGRQRDVAEHLASLFGSAYRVPMRSVKGVQGSFEVADTPAG